MKLYAYKENDKVVVERILETKGFRKPKNWIEITEDDLPERQHRNAWDIVDGKLTIDPVKQVNGVKVAKRNKRRESYHNGDYVDALMKQANQDRLNGKNLVQDLDDALGHWLKVKSDNPL